MKKVNLKYVSNYHGRKICYAEFGLSAGYPIIYVHHGLGCHVEAQCLSDIARQHGFRLIAIDRPAIGYSDPQNNRNLLDFSEDVKTVMRELELQRVGLLGCGIGAAYALGCAYNISERLDFVFCISSFIGAKKICSLKQLIASAIAPVLCLYPVLFRLFYKMIFSKADRAILKDKALLNILIENLKIASYNILFAPTMDNDVALAPLTFLPCDINMPVYFYHGMQDKNSPVANVEKLVRQMPFAKLTTFANQGLLYIFLSQYQQKIFNDLSSLLLRQQQLQEIIDS